ncbi:fibronectin type III domain-containing protein [Paenibacillus sp. BC26]|uniref:fibronectin type III domain-containing protein n=1 Tax=Paenibacillus sp. BC26 TaxID=1881032 RepID=UPI0008E74E04|nr:S-layer homology domain-containing protein [Paenibacillus sp. BC26]SFT24346.1 Ig-like domain (group 2) [Paenibacillus sp. BC26]
MNSRIKKTLLGCFAVLIVSGSAFPGTGAGIAHASVPATEVTPGSFSDSPQPGQIRIYAGADAGNSDTSGSRMVGSVVKELYLDQNSGSEAKIESQGNGVADFARYGWHKKATKRVANGSAYFSYKIPVDPAQSAPLYLVMEGIGEIKLTAEGQTLLDTGNSGLGVQTPWEFTLSDPSLWADGYVELKFEDADPTDGEGVNLHWLELGPSSVWRDRISHIVWDTSKVLWQAGYYEGTSSEFKGSSTSLSLPASGTAITSLSPSGTVVLNWNQPAPAPGKKYYLLAGLIGGTGNHTFDFGANGSIEATREASKERITDLDVTAYIADGANSLRIATATGSAIDFVSLVEVSEGATSDDSLKVVFKGNEMAEDWTRLVNNTMYFHMDMMTEKSTGFIDSSLPNGIFPLLYWVADSAPAMLEMARWGYVDEAKQASLFRSASNHYTGDNGAAGLVFSTIAYLIKGDNYVGDYVDKAWPVMKDGLDYYKDQISNNSYHLIKGTGLETTNKGYGIYNNSIAYFTLLAGAEVASKTGHASEAADWLASADLLAQGMSDNLVAHTDLTWLGHTIKKDTWRYSLDGTKTDGSDAPWINAGWFGVGSQEELYYGYKSPTDTRNSAVEDWRQITNNTLDYHSENFWADWKLYGHNRGFGTDYGVLSERGGWPLLSMLMSDRMDMAKKNLQHVIWNSTDLNFAHDNEGVQETSPWLLVREVNKSDHGIAEQNEIGNGGANEDMNLVEYIVALKNVRVMAGLDDALEGTSNLNIVPRIPSSWDGVKVNNWLAHYRDGAGNIGQTDVSYDYSVQPEQATLRVSAANAIEGSQFRFGPFAKDAAFTAVTVNGSAIDPSDYSEEISGDSKWVWVKGSMGMTSSTYAVQVDIPHLSFENNFDSANLSDWSSLNGDSWTADNGKLEAQSADGDLLLNDATQEDLIYSTDIKLNEEGAAGLSFRTNESGENGYDFVLDSKAGAEGELKLATRQGKVLYSQPMNVNMNRTYTLKVIAAGPILMGYLDGTKVFHIVDSTYEEGHAGLYAQGRVSFDNGLANDSASSVAIPSLVSVKISSYKTNTMLLTQEKEIPVIATFDNGETLDVTHVPALRQYIISDPTVFTEDHELLKAIKVGTANVSASVTINGVTKQSNSLAMKAEDLSYAEIYYKDDKESMNLMVNETVQVWPWAKLKDGIWWFLGYMPASTQIHYISSNPGVATVTHDPANADPESRSMLKAIGAGTATITMEVTVNGVTVTSPNSISITVIDPSQFTGFADNFDDGDLVGWAKSGPGVWSVQDGQAKVSNPQPTGWDSWNIMNAQGKDFVYSGDVTFKNGQAAGLSFRTNDTGSTGYDLILDKNEGLKLAGRPYRAFKTVQTPFADNQTYHVKIVAKDDNIKVYLNGALKMDYNETVYGYTFGKFGMFSFQSEASFDNLKAETTIKLDQATATLADSSLLVGQSTQLRTTGKLNNEEEADLSAATYVYASSDESVATVDANGEVTATGAGTATIYADITLNGTTVRSTSADLVVTIDDSVALLDSVSASVSTPQMNIAAITTIAVSGTMTNGTAADLTDATITYASDHAAVATVDESGTVTAKSFGTANLTVTVKLNGVTKFSNSVTITVAGTETFTENFDDGDTSGWAPNGGVWSNAGDRMRVDYLTANSWFDAWNIFDKQGQDFIYSADVKLINGNSTGISFRTNANGTQGYDVILSVYDGLKLAKRPYAEIIRYTSFTKALNQTYHLKVVVKGSNIKVYLDGVLAIDKNDSTYASGKFGLFAFQGTAEYDNLQVHVWDVDAPAWSDASLTASNATSTGMTLNWNSAVDTTGVTQYRVYQNGLPIANVAGNVQSYSVEGLTPETEYSFKVEAVDAAENWSTNGPSVTASTLSATEPGDPDVLAPVWTPEASLSAANITKTGLQLAWSTASDNIGVTQYQIYQDGTSIATVAGSINEYTLDGLSSGTAYHFKVEAADAAGNWSTDGPSATATTLNEDEEPGNSDILAPVWSKGATFEATNISQTGLQLAWSPADDEVGVTQYRVYQNNVLLATVLDSVHSYTVTGLTSGTVYDFKVKAADAAGNWNDGLSVSARTLDIPYISIPVPPTPPLPDTVAVIPAEQWQSPPKDGIHVNLPQGKEQVLLPEGAASKLGNSSLIVAGGTSAITLNAATLQAAEKLMAATVGPNAQLVVGIRTLTGEQAQVLSQAPTPPGVRMQLAGGIASLQFSAIDSKGNLVALDGTQLPGQLTLHYKGSSDNELLLGAYRLNETTGVWEYLPGAIDRHNDQAVVSGSNLNNIALMVYDRSFDDVANTNWAYEALKVMSAQHLVNGTSETLFSPNAKTTRAEFAAMLVRLLGIETTARSAFTDVDQDAWYAQSVAAASEAGLVLGDGSHFNPDATITREEIAVMIVRAFHYKNKDNDSTQSGASSTGDFKDQAKLSDWSSEFVKQAASLGLMQGNGDGTFAPKSNAVRAETMQAVYNLFKLLDQ